MSRPDLRAAVSQIHRLAGTQAPDEFPDRELLERFRGRRDEAAFAALVRRHGPMVWGVCRRVLGDHHDAEDTFQAAFLVLADKAGSIRRAESLGAWLHRVARQLALRARRRRHRRQQVETGYPADGRGTPAAGAELPEELSLREALATLDEEVGRLPEKFRTPIVLCYLQGKTNEEAARELGCAAGTLKWRLGRARELLSECLAGRGVSLPAGATALLLATGISQAALQAPPTAAAFSIHQTNGASAEAGQLAHELIRGMTMHRIKLWVLGFLALTVVGVGAGVAVRQSLGGGDHPASVAALEEGEPADRPAAKIDLHGDPLPPGATARLGTIRWRHGTRAGALAFAAGGKEIVTAGPDGLARVWDAATGRELRRFGKRVKAGPADLLFLRPAALSADGKRAATCDEGGVRVWDVGTGKELRHFAIENLNQLLAVAFTPDGAGLLTSTFETKLVLWDVATGKERRRFESRVKKGDDAYAGISRLVFSPDGKLLGATFFEDLANDQTLRSGVRLWDVATGKEVLRLGGPLKIEDVPPEVPYPAFSPDGQVLARVAPDGTIRLHGTADGKQKRSLGGADKDEVIGWLAFAPSGKTLAASLCDGRVRLYDAGTGKKLHLLAEGAGRRAGAPGYQPLLPLQSAVADFSPDAPPLAFSPDGKTLATLSVDNTVRLWDTATGKPLPSPAGHSGAVADLAASADGKAVVTRGTDGTLRRWERATGKELRRVPVPGGAKAAVLSPTGRLLAYADEMTARVWDVAAGKESVKIKLPQDAMGPGLVSLLKFSADEKVLATVDWSGAVRLWDAATGKALRTLPAAEKDGEARGMLSMLEFSRDGRTLLTVRMPNPVVALGQAKAPQAPEAPQEPKSYVCLWDTATGTVVRRWGAKGVFMSAALTPDGHAVVTAAAEGVTLWEVATGRERFRTKEAVIVGCSPDGRVLATADGTTTRLLDLRTGKEFAQLKGHEAEVRALAFTPDGKGLVSGSADSTALVWKVTRPAAKVQELGAKRLAELWVELADPDAGKAFRAAAELGASPKGAAALLAKHVKPVPAPDAKQVARWVADLDADSFEARKKAAGELARLGELAQPALQEALKKKPSLELRRRAEELLGRLTSREEPSAEGLRQLRTVEVLEGIGTTEARGLLEKLAQGAPGARLTRDAKAALQRLGR
jgi:RNA polymerase sigma factor (sigma-70 family)